MNSLTLQKIIRLPSVPFEHRDLLPESFGLCFVLTQTLSSRLVYIGKVGTTQTFRDRWKSHHRLPELSLLRCLGVPVDIAWLELRCDDPFINKWEQDAIDNLNPPLNATLSLQTRRNQQALLDQEALPSSVEVSVIDSCDPLLEPFTPSEMQRTSAIVNALKLLIKFDRIDAAKQVKTLLDTEPDRALWLSLKSLGLGVTAASRDVLGCGDGGRSFVERGKPWYEALEQQFGAIKE